MSRTAICTDEADRGRKIQRRRYRVQTFLWRSCRLCQWKDFHLLNPGWSGAQASPELSQGALAEKRRKTTALFPQRPNKKGVCSPPRENAQEPERPPALDLNQYRACADTASINESENEVNSSGPLAPTSPLNTPSGDLFACPGRQR